MSRAGDFVRVCGEMGVQIAVHADKRVELRGDLADLRALLPILSGLENEVARLAGAFVDAEKPLFREMC